MRIHFIGADLEENLGLGILTAIAEQHGHTVTVVPFNDIAETEHVVGRVMKKAPDLVGLSIQFQHRAPEFILLARKLRQAGFAGHLTCGGQFPTLAWQETLQPENGVDSIVLHDGEETLVDLLQALEHGSALADLRGLALLGDGGVAHRTPSRPLLDDLDSVPFAKRYRHHNQHMSVPFIPLIGGRGCWGKCNYCSIIAFYDDAIESGGGRAVRLRSPANIAAEMALLLDNAGGRGIFCFHDDNFLFPGEKFSLKRIRLIREALDEYGVGKVALIGKARPDCVTPALARALADLGVIRLYIGVENGSETGGEHLRRGMQQQHVRGALKACREAGIFVCYNLLIFEPDAKIDDVRENVRFIRDHADHPVNFCRAEPYFGTALHVELGKIADLGGDYLGFNYRIADDRTELLFRISSAAFRERNFAPQGVANRYMGLGYAANVLVRFYDVDGNAVVFQRRARELTRKISLDTAEYLDKAIALAQSAKLDDWDDIERKTAMLGLEIAAADRHWHRELDELYGDMRAFAAHPPIDQPSARRPTARFERLKSSMAIGMSLGLVMASCGEDVVVDDAASSPSSSRASSGEGGMVVDPAPGPGGMGGAGGMGGEGGMVVDPAPGPGGAGGIGGMGGMSSFDPERQSDGAETGAPQRKLRLIDQWFDTSPKHADRTADLPLFAPPNLALEAERDADGELSVRLKGIHAHMTTRWEADGDVIGKGGQVRWRPRDDADRIRVAVRSRGGVSVFSLRATEAKLVV